MKKVTLLLLLLISFFGYSQTEGFEGDTFPPAGWTVFDNGVGTAQSWDVTTTAANVNSGTKAAQVLRENVGMGNTSEDWLVTPMETMPVNAQLKFFARSFLTGDNGTKYQIWLSTTAATGPTDKINFIKLKEYTSLELSNPTNVYNEKKVSLPSTAGEKRYIAFVRVFTQTGLITSGDRWLLDDVSIVEQCLDPTLPNVKNIKATTADLSWSYGSGASFDVQCGPKGFTVGSSPFFTANNISTTQINATGLPEKTQCEFYVRANCSSTSSSSDWIGPISFTTRAIGTYCDQSIVVSQLPFQVVNDNTANYGDEIDVLQGAACGAVPSSTNYLLGNDVFYSFVPTKSGPVSFTLTPKSGSTNSSIFIYASCSDIGVNCIGGKADPSSAVRVVNLNVTSGLTYYIVISSSSTGPTSPSQTIGYGLLIQTEDCIPKPSGGFASQITTSSASLSWADSSSSFTSWQVEIQPLGSPVPSGAGTYTATSNTAFPVTGLDPGTPYQFWVRAECTPVPSGVYTAWAGPYLFNTLICDPGNACVHTFRMTDVIGNGWNGALMQVRQNGIVVATIGSTFTIGGGPIDIPVSLCKDKPFDIYWVTKGTAPEQCVVSVINSFGQTIFTHQAGYIPSDNIVYSGVVNCSIALCDLPPTQLSSTVSAHYADLSWSAPSTSMWDVYVVNAGSSTPSPITVPTYSGVTSYPLTATTAFNPSTNVNEALLADTCYDFYVRVVCTATTNPSSGVSQWSNAGTFCTLATCPKPIPADPVTSITTTSATLSWTSASFSDTKWEILLVPSATGVPPTQLPPVTAPYPGNLYPITDVPATTHAFSPTDLTPATIYFYYIRTVCSGTDSSVWSAAPIKFNTVTCAAADKCVYKFSMTDTAKDGWNNGRMQVRQNGIVIATIGSTITGSGPTNVNVSLCTGVPFDVYWSNGGDKPEEIGLTVQNPFSDLLYTKAPGEGNPLDVLFASTANCTQPTCPKPTLLGAISASDSATLSWTPGGSESQWEVYVVPVGSAPPLNESPINVANVTTNNPFLVTGLQPSTNYIFYVRALCSPTDKSTWTLLTPATFTTLPTNDECATATVVPVNPTRVCDLSVTGNTYGATASAQPNTCAGSTDDDIWYTFVATSNVHVINLTNIVGGTKYISHTVYLDNASDCSSLTQLYCSAALTSVATNLTIGKTYKIRVYTTGTVSSQTVTFNLCIITPPAIANDECINATQTPVNSDLPCVVYSSGSLTGATASAEPSTCIGTRDDDVWFSFVATTNQHYFTLKNVVGSTNDLNFAIYSGTCGNLTPKFCSIGNSLVGNYNGFVANQTYYVRVWSYSNVLQDVTFDLCIGKVVPPITTSTSQYTNQELVEDILLKTKCASVTNIKSSTGVNFGSVNGIGYFNKSLSGFPFKDGVILSSGNVLRAPGPNSFILNDGSGDWPGDIDLEVSNPGMLGQNASVLEFDFIPLADKISFNFLFASEEYGIFQCSYSDAFAFYLTDTETKETTNLATVPITNDIISVTNVRDETYNSLCDSKNVTYFGNYYLPPGLPSLGAPTNYNGMTIPMTAKSGVIPNRKYHIKMVIADRLDTNYDSAVFLEGGSFNIGNVELGDDLVGQKALCKGSTTTLHSGLDSTKFTIFWTKDGDSNVIPNETGPDLVVSEPGIYAVWAQFSATTSCIDKKDFIQVDYYQEPLPGKPKNLINCGVIGTPATFDLTQNTPIILAPFASDVTKVHTLNYFLTQDDADNNVNPIADPANFLFTGTTLQTIYVRVSNDYIACYQISSFQVGMEDSSPKFTLEGVMSYCPQGSTTISVLPIDNDFDPNMVTYSWTNSNGVVVGTENSLLISTEANYGTYTVTVNNGCSSSQSFDVTNSNAVWDFAITAPATLCPTEPGILSVNVTNNSTGTPATYTYTFPDLSVVGPTQNNSVAIAQVGTYTVNVDILGCSTSNSITVGTSVANWDVTFLNTPYLICSNQSVELSFKANNFDINNPSAIYTWTLPNAATATGPTVNSNQLGTHTLEVNLYGCVSTKDVSVSENTNTIGITIDGQCDGNQFKLIANGSFDAASTYVWSGPNFTAVPDAPNTIILNAIGTYTVKVTTPDGCSSEESIDVTDISCSVQKGISPNGDGFNESFILMDVKKLEIFNRYGLKVYSLLNYTNQWHGQTNDGKELPDGTYYYVIERNNGQNITGWIYINR